MILQPIILQYKNKINLECVKTVNQNTEKGKKSYHLFSVNITFRTLIYFYLK